MCKSSAGRRGDSILNKTSSFAGSVSLKQMSPPCRGLNWLQARPRTIGLAVLQKSPVSLQLGGHKKMHARKNASTSKTHQLKANLQSLGRGIKINQTSSRILGCCDRKPVSGKVFPFSASRVHPGGRGGVVLTCKYLRVESPERSTWMMSTLSAS